MTIERTYIKVLEKRMKEPRKFIQVISGPRQVGKTTLVMQLMKSLDFPSFYTTADSTPNATGEWLVQQWEMARLKWAENPEKDMLLVIDEIQKVVQWSEWVKWLWEEDGREKRQIKVILSGSSRLLIQEGLTESLAGRFETHYLGHWSLGEMETTFGFTPEQYAWFGGYPGAATLIEDETRWKQYISNSLIEPSISRDILMLTRIDKPALMKRLFELGSLYSSQILSFNKILGQLKDAGNTTTLSKYLELLDAAGLLAGAEKYSGSIVNKRSSSPKFLVYNTALMSAQMGEDFHEIQQKRDVWGRIVESAIGSHLLNQARLDGFEVMYWRDRNDEIDFVLRFKGKILAIEVKTGAMGVIPGLKAFKKAYGAKKSILVGSGGMPWPEFLRMRTLDLF